MNFGVVDLDSVWVAEHPNASKCLSCGQKKKKKTLFEVIFAVDFKTNSSVEISKFMALMLRGNC